MTYNPRKQYHYGDYEELQYELQILLVSKFPNKTGLTIDNGYTCFRNSKGIY